MKRKNNTKNTKRSKVTHKPKITQALFRGEDRDTYVVPKRFRIMPPSIITQLVFFDTSHSPLNNAGATFASVRFRPSSAFDVDPTIGGTSIPGFNELAGLYGRYRMVAFSADVTAVNDENFPINVMVFPSNFDLGSNYSQVQSMVGNSLAKIRYLSPRGGMDRSTIHTPWWSANRIVGSDAPMVDTDFSASVSGNPVNNTYLNIGIWTGNSTALVNGVGLKVVITIQIKYYEQFHNVTLPDPPQLHPELRPVRK